MSVHVRNEMWKTRKQLRNVIKKNEGQSGRRDCVIVPKKVERGGPYSSAWSPDPTRGFPPVGKAAAGWLLSL